MQTSYTGEKAHFSGPVVHLIMEFIQNISSILMICPLSINL
jgi:hypothetical protein